MNVVVRPEVERDICDAATWYEEREPGLGADFVDEVLKVFDALAENPLLNSRRHPTKNIRWRYPERFPYRIVYEVTGDVIVIAAVIHAARHDRQWQRRIG